MKLTCSMLNGLTEDTFSNGPAVDGELECFVRFIMSREGKIVVVADTKDDSGGERARAARFMWAQLPDGCNKGSKIKLAGINFVERSSREYPKDSGKIYHDMVYSFATCEVLEATARQGGGGRPGGGYRGGDKSPDERRSIEAQAVMHDAVKVAIAVAEHNPGHVIEDILGDIDRAADHLWKKLHTIAPEAPPPPPATAGGPSTAEQASSTTAGAQASPGATGNFRDSLSEAGRGIATTVGRLVVEMFGAKETPLALVNLTEWVNRDGETVAGVDSVDKIASERQAKAIQVHIGPIHHWWKTAGAVDQAKLADVVLEPRTGPKARGEEIAALMKGEQGPKFGQPEAPDIEVTSPYEIDPEAKALFLRHVREASGAKDDTAAVAAIEKTATAIWGTRFRKGDAMFLSGEAMNCVLKEMRK